jgi:hypothetical protein
MGKDTEISAEITAVLKNAVEKQYELFKILGLAYRRDTPNSLLRNVPSDDKGGERSLEDKLAWVKQHYETNLAQWLAASAVEQCAPYLAPKASEEEKKEALKQYDGYLGKIRVKLNGGEKDDDIIRDALTQVQQQLEARQKEVQGKLQEESLFDIQPPDSIRELDDDEKTEGIVASRKQQLEQASQQGFVAQNKERTEELSSLGSSRLVSGSSFMNSRGGGSEFSEDEEEYDKQEHDLNSKMSRASSVGSFSTAFDGDDRESHFGSDDESSDREDGRSIDLLPYIEPTDDDKSSVFNSSNHSMISKTGRRNSYADSFQQHSVYDDGDDRSSGYSSASSASYETASEFDDKSIQSNGFSEVPAHHPQQTSQYDDMYIWREIIQGAGEGQRKSAVDVMWKLVDVFNQTEDPELQKALIGYYNQYVKQLDKITDGAQKERFKGHIASIAQQWHSGNPPILEALFRDRSSATGGVHDDFHYENLLVLNLAMLAQMKDAYDRSGPQEQQTQAIPQQPLAQGVQTIGGDLAAIFREPLCVQRSTDVRVQENQDAKTFAAKIKAQAEALASRESSRGT